ncbi:protease modulator HflK [Novosphingobium sp.]|uniref:protease modulator HflK n=1 Tax=Novosphingobium sp. TaxID=1874826 RepID=UPI0033424047
MDGLDTGKATDGPADDGSGVAHHDGPRAAVAPDAPAADAVDGVAASAPLRVNAPGPWHHSRVRQPARSALRPVAPLPGARAAAWLARRLPPVTLRPFGSGPASRWLPWLGGALVLAGLAATTVHPVGVQEQAIVATAGAWGPTLGPGLALSWPWPIGAVRIENVTGVRHLAVPDSGGEHLLLTRDGALADVAWDVRWRIRDLQAHALGLADPDLTLRLAADAAMRSVVASVDFAAVIGPGRATIGPAAAHRLQAMLDRDHAGIVIDGVDLRRADPPARAADAFRAVNTARSDAATEAVQAHSWARQTVTRASGDAAAFDKVHDQYARAPAVTRRQIYYATMERVLGQNTTVIVDAPGTTVTLPPPVPAGTDAAHGGAATNGH